VKDYSVVFFLLVGTYYVGLGGVVLSFAIVLLTRPYSVSISLTTVKDRVFH
jgi:hypothetical protein